MAETNTGPVTTGQRSLLRRLLGSRWLLYFVGIEVFLGAVAFLALTFMAQNSFQGVIVGMAISLGVLVVLVAFVAILVAGWRQLRTAISQSR